MHGDKGEKSQKSPNEEKDLQTNDVSDHDTIVFVTIHPKGLIMQFNVNKLTTGQQPRLHLHWGQPSKIYMYCQAHLCMQFVFLDRSTTNTPPTPPKVQLYKYSFTIE